MICLKHKKILCSEIAGGKRRAGVEKKVLTKLASSFLVIILPSILSDHHHQLGSDETNTISSPSRPIPINDMTCLHFRS